jgi:tetratricopeptide (TPR) repeat protein
MTLEQKSERRRVKFPQISRLFSALPFRPIFVWTGKLLLWTFLVALFCVNALQLTHTNSPIAIQLFHILEQPFTSTSHVKSALELHKLGLDQSATKELILAQDLQKPSDGHVLGATTDPGQIVKEWANQPKKLEEQYSYWKEVIAQKPDYRDAFIISGLLAYELGKTDEATTLLEKALALDPNNTTITSLLQQITGKK